MTIDFALSLSFEGIELLQRVQRGWRRLGQVDVGSETLDADLADLRQKGEALAPNGFYTKLILPLDQIKYTAIEGTLTTQSDIDAELEGATPYALDELVIDCERFGGRTHIAAVARETLKEAEVFAAAHGFNPVAFVAVPEPFTFQKEVFFGPTEGMRKILGRKAKVTRDALPVMIVGTRIKSRLLVFDQTEDIEEDVYKDDLAELLAGEVKATEAASHDDLADVSAGTETASVETDTSHDSTQSKSIWVDPVPAEFYPLQLKDDKEALRPALVPTDFAGYQPRLFDTIVAEFHPQASSAPTAKLVAVAANASGQAPKLGAAPVAKRTVKTTTGDTASKTPALIAIAASVALIAGGLIWSQQQNETVPVTQEAAPVAQDATAPDETFTSEVTTEVAQAATPNEAALANLDLTPSTEDAVQSQAARPELELDVAADTADLPNAAPSEPSPNAFAIALPSFGAEVSDEATLPSASPNALASVADPARGAPILLVLNDADAPMATVEGPPEPPTQLLADVADPTPPPQGTVMSPAQATRIYQTTGVWQRAPRLIDQPSGVILLDFQPPAPPEPVLRIALPERPPLTGLDNDLSFLAPADPPPASAVYARDENGFILATPEGTLTPEGALVFAGLPDLEITPRPALTQAELDRMELLAPAPEGVIIIAGRPDIIPPLRPADLQTSTQDIAEAEAASPEATSPGSVGVAGLELQNSGAIALDTSVVENASENDLRPLVRPQELAAAADARTPDITDIIAGIESEDATLRFDNSTQLAVVLSIRPDKRPSNFATVVAAAQARQATVAIAPATPNAPVTAAAPVPPQNFEPVPGGVARAATQEDAIRLRDINLIGVYGRPNARRALVRLSNGRYVRVEIGSALDGGQVTAIGDNALNYVKRGRTYAIELPSG